MAWDNTKPICDLPDFIQKHFINEAKFLYDELQKQKLQVCLIDAPDPQFMGHKIRVVNESNPEWYSELYSSHNHFRRDRSLNALNRLQNNRDCKYTGELSGAVKSKYSYDSIFRELIYERLTDFYESEGDLSIPNPVVFDYFDVK